MEVLIAAVVAIGFIGFLVWRHAKNNVYSNPIKPKNTNGQDGNSHPTDVDGVN